MPALKERVPVINVPEAGQRTVGRDRQGMVLLLLAAAVFGGILGGRLAYLQLWQGEKNRQLAENNRIRLIAKPPERGRIFDRRGQLLASNRLAYVVNLWPIAQKKEAWPETIARLSPVIGVRAAEIQRKLELEGYNSPSLVRVSGPIPPAAVTFLAEHAAAFPGVQVEPEAVRLYPHGDTAAHVLGYTGPIDAEDLARLQDKGYRLRDVLGKAGVEMGLESWLRGEWGGQQVEVDASGRVVQVLGEKPPKPGNSLRLTLDLRLQKAAEAILGETKGAIVAIDPRTGEVLAMASWPKYNPNIFSGPIAESTWQALQSQDNPFLNRALRAFPPASTFKVVTAVAGLESGKFGIHDYLPTFPYLEFGGIQFWDNNRAGFGTIGFAEAMAYSSNTFFGQVGQRVGIETLAAWARRFGFGSRTGIELAPEESPGLVPDPAWKEAVLQEPWYIGNTINTAIGQGDVQATPLQVATMIAAIANGGYVVTPHLNLDAPAAKIPRRSLGLRPETLAKLRESLRAVFEYGTAQSLYGSVAWAGKSGTAEDPPRPHHAWFAAYGPADRPQIAVAVFVENAGGGGSTVAGPMAVAVMEAYLRLKP